MMSMLPKPLCEVRFSPNGKAWRVPTYTTAGPLRPDSSNDDLIGQAHKALAMLPPDTLQSVVSGLEVLVVAPPPSASLTAAFNGGTALSDGERSALHAVATAQQFALRRQLLAGSLNASEVARLLGTSRQTPLDRARAGTLLALSDGKKLRFPSWQFDPDAPRGVLKGLPEILAALQVSEFAKARWLTREHQGLNGTTPLAALQAGAQDRVQALAAKVGLA